MSEPAQIRTPMTFWGHISRVVIFHDSLRRGVRETQGALYSQWTSYTISTALSLTAFDHPEYIARIHNPTTSPGWRASMNLAPSLRPQWVRANSPSGACPWSHSTVYRSKLRLFTRLYCTGHKTTRTPAGFGTSPQPDCILARRETLSSVVRHGQWARTKARSASLSRRAISSSSSVGRNMQGGALERPYNSEATTSARTSGQTTH